MLANSTIYTRIYSGASGGTWSSNKETSVTPSTSYTTVFSCGAARSMQTSWTAMRILGSSTWRLLGSVGYGGALNTLSFDIELTASSDEVVPTVYSSGWASAITTSFSYLEILEG